jgi:hypothetical protein
MNKNLLFATVILFAVSCSSKEEKKEEKKDEPKEEAVEEEAPAEEMPVEEAAPEESEEAAEEETKSVSTPAVTPKTEAITSDKKLESGVKSKGIKVQQDITVGEEGVK